MKLMLEAACGCHMGKIRRNNEDNFFFDGKCLEEKNTGMHNTVCMDEPLQNGLCLAVFDGMGGESFGETASFTAARAMQKSVRTLADYFVSEKKYLKRLCTQMNDAVVEQQKLLQADRMGTTVAALYFSSRYVYVCNVGDSRAYRLRSGEFMQLSRDHVSARPMPPGRKAPLTQHLGIDPEEMLIEPYIAKGEVKKGDWYLLCSDGLTDMLDNFTICDIMIKNPDADICAQALIRAALEKGGRDNITAIICHIC